MNGNLGSSHLPLRDLVTQDLRRRILVGEFVPGERLVEDRLAELLGVSRNPVREAIRVLSAEGFVEVTPRRGAAVSRLSAEEAEELFDVRMALEGLAARLAARKQSPAAIQKLRDLLARSRAAVEGGDLLTVADLNTEFHTAVAEAAGNAYLNLVAGPMLRRAQWVFLQTAGARAPHSWTEHVGLLVAITDGDESAAEQHAVAHVEAARRSYLSALSPEMIID
ncbi:GntR family transcriptional regulator [Micromonospora sp. NPDC049559]|uniref:GntR family transcriptional regulator n=1 Tax=Micromonospora sp. NPDC049559 TaxID=3155923 RepID=UPI00344728A9